MDFEWRIPFLIKVAVFLLATTTIRWLCCIARSCFELPEESVSVSIQNLQALLMSKIDNVAFFKFSHGLCANWLFDRVERRDCRFNEPCLRLQWDFIMGYQKPELACRVKWCWQVDNTYVVRDGSVIQSANGNRSEVLFRLSYLLPFDWN